MATVPIENANPTMWMHSRIGKASADEFRGLVISTLETGYFTALHPPHHSQVVTGKSFASVPSLPEL